MFRFKWNLSRTKSIKKIILLFIVIMLTGCDIEYNLTIEDNTLKEETKFIVSSNEYQNDNRIKTLYDYPHSIFINEENAEENGITTNEEFTYYDKSITSNNGNYNIIYKANYEKDNYKESRMLNTAFTGNSIEIYSNQGFIIARDLSLFDNYKSYNIDKITVNIKVDDEYQVTNNNATSVNNNIYTWIFYNNTETDKDVILEFEKKKTVSEDITKPDTDVSDKGNKNYNFGLYIFLAIVVIIILIGYVMFNKMKEKNNQMDD